MRNSRNRIKRGIEEKKEENKKYSYKYHNRRTKSEEAKKVLSQKLKENFRSRITIIRIKYGDGYD
jgi:hypothetical protein